MFKNIYILFIISLPIFLTAIPLKRFNNYYLTNNSFNYINQTNYKCHYLSLSGGGSHGAFESGVISNLVSKGKNWNSFFGISVGSLNSAFLSRYGDQIKGAEELKNIYFTIKNKDVYKFSMSSLFKGKSFYDTTPLNNLVLDKLNKTEYNFSIYPTYLGATHLNSGSLKLFSLENNKDNNLVAKMILASSAIPFLFPAVELEKNQFYVDGGVDTDELVYEPIKICSEIEMDLILSYNPFNPKINKKHWNFFSVLERVIQIIYQNYNNEIIEAISLCNENSQQKGFVNIYYPQRNINVSLLDFSKGKELWEMGFNNFIYKKMPICL